MLESPVNHLPRLLKAKGRSMSRQKYQRPEVYATGKREKLWKGEWREYYIDAEGKEQSRHKSKTWSRANYTKAEAQAELDVLLRELQQGGPKADGAMTLTSFWETVYYPVKVKRWSQNTRRQVDYLWAKYIQPHLGSRPLIEIKRPAVEMLLVKAADAGMGWSILQSIASHLSTALVYAMDADYIQKNPCRKAELPTCRPPKEIRAMTVEEVQCLWDKTEGTDYLIWRVLLLTGARISELLALERTDLLPDGRLRIDESALNRMPSTTKNKKTRIAPLPASLRAELEAHIASHQHQLIFPHPDAKMSSHDDNHIRQMVDRARIAAGIPDLTPRVCRTTWATLFQGDIRDAQEILGHHSAAFTLQVYRKPVADRQMAAIEELDRRLKVVPIKRGA